MIVTRGDIKLDVGPVRWTEYWELWESGGWEPAAFAAIDELAPCRYLDIGAWVGPLALYAAARGCEVAAYEPDPIAAAALRDNAMNNGLDIDIYEMAVTPPPHDGIELYANDGWGHSQPSTVRQSGLALRVANTGWPAGPWGLVKVDIEGAEAALAAYYAAQMAAQPLILSLHAPWWPPDGHRHIARLLGRFGSLVASGDHGDPTETGPFDLVVCRP